MRPLAIDLFCGLGGWAEGFLSEGYQVIGFDIERRPYPGELVLQDVLTLHGRQFRDVACIVASPPCQAYSYMAMPWKRAKALAAWYRTIPKPGPYDGSWGDQRDLNRLFDACFRIQREASEAAGRYIPLVVENVKGAQPWVGRAKAHFGSFYLWGDVESIGNRIVAAGQVRFGVEALRSVRRRKPDDLPQLNGLDDPRRGRETNGSWFAIGADGKSNLRATKNNGGSYEHEKTGKPGRSFQSAAVKSGGVKQEGSGAAWFDNGLCKLPSGSNRRKEASAQIARIPLELSRHIAACFKPEQERAALAPE